MNVCAIIQARINSVRLPGKVLLEINGRPMISYMLERVARAKTIQHIILATGTDPADDPLADFCKKNNIACYRGSQEDVLDRYYQAAKTVHAQIVVRLTGDCPLIDPNIVDAMVTIFRKGDYDYVANTISPKWTVPEGMDVEIFSFKNLERAWQEAKKPSEREHVTFYFWKNPQLFSIYQYKIDEDLSGYRLTVDYPEDFEVVRAVMTHLYPQNPRFSMQDIVEFLKNHPEIHERNKNIQPNQGWKSALNKDQAAGFITER